MIRICRYATILAFDVKIEKDAQELADSLGVKIFQADIIYHLFDKFINYREELKQRKRDENKHIAVFPCKLKILPQVSDATRRDASFDPLRRAEGHGINKRRVRGRRPRPRYIRLNGAFELGLVCDLFQYIFNSRDPIVMGVMVEAGIVKEGTPICVPSKDVSPT